MTAQKAEDEAADGVEIFVGKGQGEVLVEIVDPEAGIQAIDTGADFQQQRLLAVIFVLDVPDQLFQQVLHRYQARRAAVFILHDGEHDARAAKLVEQLADLAVLRDYQRQAHDGPEREISLATRKGGQQVFRMDDPDDVVHAALTHGNTRVTTAHNQLQQGGQAGVHIQRFDVDARGHHPAHIRVTKGDHIPDDLFFLFFNRPRLRTGFEQRTQLLLRNDRCGEGGGQTEGSYQ